MKTFEYQCICGYTFEQRLSFSDITDQALCPECGRWAERRISVIQHVWKKGQEPK